MSRSDHRMASRARAIASCTGIPEIAPRSNSARRRSASADQASATSVSAARLASSLSANCARSSGERRSACASTSAIDIDICLSSISVRTNDTRPHWPSLLNSSWASANTKSPGQRASLGSPRRPSCQPPVAGAIINNHAKPPKTPHPHPAHPPLLPPRQPVGLTPHVRHRRRRSLP